MKYRIIFDPQTSYWLIQELKYPLPFKIPLINLKNAWVTVCFALEKNRAITIMENIIYGTTYYDSKGIEI